MDPIRDKQFDDRLKERLNAFEPQVPKHTWGDIVSKLDEKNVVPLKKRGTKFLWLKAAAAVVIMVGVLMLFLNKPKEIIYLTANKKIETREEHKPTAKKTPMRNVSAQTTEQPPIKPTEQTIAEVANVRQKTSTAALRNILEEKAKAPDLVVIASKVALAEPRPGELIDKGELYVNEVQQPSLEENTPAIVATEPLREKRKFGVGNLLNYVVSSVDQGKEKVISFANDDEGTIKVAVNFKALRMRL